jgi:hypothetical protein
MSSNHVEMVGVYSRIQSSQAGTICRHHQSDRPKPALDVVAPFLQGKDNISTNFKGNFKMFASKTPLSSFHEGFSDRKKSIIMRGLQRQSISLDVRL